MPEDGLRLFQFKRRSDAEHAFVAVETAIRHEDVAVRIEAEEVTASDPTGKHPIASEQQKPL